MSCDQQRQLANETSDLTEDLHGHHCHGAGLVSDAAAPPMSADDSGRQRVVRHLQREQLVGGNEDEGMVTLSFDTADYGRNYQFYDEDDETG